MADGTTKPIEKVKIGADGELVDWILKICRQMARLRQRCASREVLPSAILRAT